MSKKPNLREMMVGSWLDGCVDGRVKLTEQSRVFSIKVQSPGQAVLLRPEYCPEWPRQEKKCDGVLLCYNGSEARMTLVLVELKGGNVEKALHQLEATCRHLCAQGKTTLNKHKEWKDALGAHSLHHARRVFGLIVGKKSLAKHQQKRSALRKQYGLKIRATTGNLTGKTIPELENFLS